MSRKKIRRYLRHYASKDRKCTSKSVSESIVHKLAKQVISELSSIRLPEVRMERHGNIPRFVIEAERTVHITDVKLEKTITVGNSSIRPDLELTIDNGEKLYIEIEYKHRTVGKKLENIRKLGENFIEISLKELSAEDDNLKEKIIDIAENRLEDKKWLYHKEGALLEHYLNSAPQLKTSKSSYDDNILVWDCPLRLRIKGDSDELMYKTEEELSTLSFYAYVKDCEKCQHFIGRSKSNAIYGGEIPWVICNAVKCAETIDEYDTDIDKQTREKRLYNYRQREKAYIKRMADKNICTNCGGKLYEIDTPDGKKLMCSNRVMRYYEINGCERKKIDECSICGAVTEEVKLRTGEVIKLATVKNEKIYCTEHSNENRYKDIKGLTEVTKVYRDVYPCGHTININDDGTIQYPVNRRRGKY